MPAEAYSYTTADIYALPEGQRAELIDGQMYDMAPPNTIHQRISIKLSSYILQYINSNKGACEVFSAPFAVFLNKDKKNYFEPDISVICDKNILNEHGCCGAPDWIIEITSPGTKSRDYGVKLYKYRSAGVREYWIINPMTNTVTVYDFEHEKMTGQYTFDERIPSCIFEDFAVTIADFLPF